MYLYYNAVENFSAFAFFFSHRNRYFFYTNDTKYPKLATAFAIKRILQQFKRRRLFACFRVWQNQFQIFVPVNDNRCESKDSRGGALSHTPVSSLGNPGKSLGNKINKQAVPHAEFPMSRVPTTGRDKFLLPNGTNRSWFFIRAVLV